MGERCNTPTCKGRYYCIGFLVEDGVWEAVIGDLYGTVCPQCFDELAQEKGIKYDFLETYPIPWWVNELPPGTPWKPLRPDLTRATLPEILLHAESLEQGKMRNIRGLGKRVSPEEFVAEMDPLDSPVEVIRVKVEPTGVASSTEDGPAKEYKFWSIPGLDGEAILVPMKEKKP